MLRGDPGTRSALANDVRPDISAYSATYRLPIEVKRNDNRIFGTPPANPTPAKYAAISSRGHAIRRALVGRDVTQFSATARRPPPQRTAEAVGSHVGTITTDGTIFFLVIDVPRPPLITHSVLRTPIESFEQRHGSPQPPWNLPLAKSGDHHASNARNLDALFARRHASEPGPASFRQRLDLVDPVRFDALAMSASRCSRPNGRRNVGRASSLRFVPSRLPIGALRLTAR